MMERVQMDSIDYCSTCCDLFLVSLLVFLCRFRVVLVAPQWFLCSILSSCANFCFVSSNCPCLCAMYVRVRLLFLIFLFVCLRAPFSPLVQCHSLPSFSEAVYLSGLSFLLCV